MGSTGINLSNVSKVDLAGLMPKNNTPKYELREKPKPKYDRVPGNYLPPGYGRNNLPIFYSVANSKAYQRRAESYKPAGLCETSETRRYS